MLTFNSKLLTISAFSIVIYLIITSVELKRNSYTYQNSVPLPNTEQRIKEIRKQASGKEKLSMEKDPSLQEKVVYLIVDYIAGEEFRKRFVKHV